MSEKTPAIVAIILTVLLLILLGLVFLFVGLVGLNGFSEQEATVALSAMLICQGVGMILAALLAGWLTRLGITKLNWHKALAVAVAVFAGTLLGGVLSLLALFFSFLLVAR